MLRQLNVHQHSFRLGAPFRISRGVKHQADVVLVELSHHGHVGRGESVPYPRYGESAESVLAQIESLRPELEAGMGRDELQSRLAPGAARNALDVAMWDLESRLSSVPVWTRLGRPLRVPLPTAQTIGLDSPDNMARAAARLSGARLLKIKVGADRPGERIAAVRESAPGPRLIVDPNESWNIGILNSVQPVLESCRVELLEQPLPADADDDLLDYAGSIPVCADEACHVTPDLPRLRNRYQAINIKLDKTGGLTEAWRLLHAARDQGFQIMVGCMVCSSLGISPALEIAREATFIDLDGPSWLAQDLPGGVRLQQGMLHPPATGFWGG